MKFEENISLKPLTTFRIGGNARYFCRVKYSSELKEAVFFANGKKLPIFALGGGSNLLISDQGFNGLVIKNEIRGIVEEEFSDHVDITVGAGVNWDEFVASTVQRGFYGLENLSGIPGTVGATPVQNIGAYGAEVKDTVISVETFDIQSGEAKIFKNEECKFAYRDSFFKTQEGKRFVAVKVTFRLEKNGTLNLGYKDIKNYFNLAQNVPTLANVRQAVLLIRAQKFPDLKTIGTAGSFFKNPIISQTDYDLLKKKFPDLPGFVMPNNKIKISLAWILDNILHYKGKISNTVGLYQKQPLVLVNLGGGTAKEVASFANDVVKKVKEVAGINISWEVEGVGL